LGLNGVKMGFNDVKMGLKWGSNEVEMGFKWGSNGVQMGFEMIAVKPDQRISQINIHTTHTNRSVPVTAGIPHPALARSLMLTLSLDR
jgi:hypothetical protein